MRSGINFLWCPRAAPLVQDILELSPNSPELLEESTVSIAATHDFTAHVLPYLVLAAGTHYPQIQLNLMAGNRTAVMNMVETGAADFGIVPKVEIPRAFAFDRLFMSDVSLVTPLGHPLSEAEDLTRAKIAEWPLITWRTGSPASGETYDRYRRERMRFKSVLTLDSLTSVKTYVALGLGVAMGPNFAIDPWDESRLNVVSLSGVVPGREIGIVTLRDKPLWKSGKLVTDMIHAEVTSSTFLTHFPYGL
ncbi:MAG: hypothetical protein FI703_03910 [SAR202 cluster bacterium]|nr:hypothetical protein [SAR202 cluster bacterium]